MSEPAEIASPTAKTEGHPRGFFHFWGEFGERCSYYGMRAILLLISPKRYKMPDGKATETYSLSRPLATSFRSSEGFSRIVISASTGQLWGFAVPYVIGQFILCLPQEQALYFALVLLACGSGVIKPNISTLMELTYDQQRPGQPALANVRLLWFYFSINVGAFVSQLSLPYLRTYLAFWHLKDRLGISELPTELKPNAVDYTFAYRTTFFFPRF